MSSMNRRLTFSTLAISTIAALALSGCSTSSEPAEDKDISIVASTAIWGDVAQNIADTADSPVTVTSIIEGNAIDPHHFEPSATDIAKAKEADIVVVGGGGYDAWLYEAVDNTTVIHAMELTSHDHDHDHHHDHDGETAENEHIWYDTEAVANVASEIAESINSINIDAHADATGYVEKLEAIHKRTLDLPEATVAQTEPIADYLLAHSQMTDITPEGYHAATIAEQEPTAADLAAFLDLINSGKLQALIYNPQTETDMTKRIHQAAKDKKIPVVEIYETPPAGESYLDLVTNAVDQLEAIQ